MTDKQSTDKTTESPSRRKLLVAVAGTGAAASVMTEWSKPVLKSLVLPAHAQTTGEEEPGGTDAQMVMQYTYGDVGTSSFSLSVSMSILNDDCQTNEGDIKMTVIHEGKNIGTCTQGQSYDSWSCCMSANASGLAEGDPITLNMEFDNGCVASVLSNLQ